MRLYTDDDITVIAEGLDLTAFSDVCVTFTDSTEAIVVNKEPSTLTLDGDDTVITVELTQQETALFVANTLSKVEVNWINENGKRKATDIGMINVYDNLRKEVWTGD